MSEIDIENYAKQLAAKLFENAEGAHTVPSQIDLVAESIPGDKSIFYSKLVAALEEEKKYNDYLSGEYGKINIHSRIGGILRYKKNGSAKKFEIIAIIDSKSIHHADIIDQVNSISNDIQIYDERLTTLKSYKVEKLKDGIDILFRFEYPIEFLSAIVWKKEEDDAIAPNEIVGYMESHELSSIGQRYIEKFFKAKFYCEDKLYNAPKTRSKIVTPELKELFSDIWENDIADFEKLLKLLQKKTKDGGPFVQINDNGDYEWITLPANGWQKFLTGFLYFCIKNGYIKFNNKIPNARLIRICKNQFNLKSLDPDNFRELREVLEEHGKDLPFEYRHPFISMFKTVAKK